MREAAFLEAKDLVRRYGMRRGLLGRMTEVTAVVENAGYLPTNVLASSLNLPWNDPVRGRLDISPGVELVSLGLDLPRAAEAFRILQAREAWQARRAELAAIGDVDRA